MDLPRVSKDSSIKFDPKVSEIRKKHFDRDEIPLHLKAGECCIFVKPDFNAKSFLAEVLLLIYILSWVVVCSSAVFAVGKEEEKSGNGTMEKK